MQYGETATVDHPDSKAIKNYPQIDNEPARVSQKLGDSSGNTYFGYDMPKSLADNVLQSIIESEYGESHTGYGHQTSPHSLAGVNFVHASTHLADQTYNVHNPPETYHNRPTVSNDPLYNLGHHHESSGSLINPELLFDDEFWPDESRSDKSRPDYSPQLDMAAFSTDMSFQHDGQYLPSQQHTTVVNTEQLQMNAVALEPWTTYSAGYPGQVMTNVHGELVSTHHSDSISSRYTNGPGQEQMSVQTSTDMADETTNTSYVLDPAGMGDSILTVKPILANNKPLDPWDEPCMSKRSESMDHDNVGEEGDIDNVNQHWNPGDYPPIPDDPNAVGLDTPHELSCLASGCNVVFHGKYCSGNQKRHMRMKHGNEVKSYACESRGCNKSFKRKDARLKHYRSRHPDFPTTRKVSRR